MIASIPSRAELLNWISDLTQTKVEKLEQLSDGIQFCQAFDHIHPKVINLNKLKRDVKVPLQKEKNFKILLNAIAQLDLLITINIAELAQGKVTALLELLQWLWKESKKPKNADGRVDGKDNKDFQPRVIKSYVGSLVTRPHQSLMKGTDKSEGTKSISSSRRSLDSRLNNLQNIDKSDEKSVKKFIQPIQQKSARMEESEGKEKIQIRPLSERKEQSQKIHVSQRKEFAEEIPENVQNQETEEKSSKIKKSKTKLIVTFNQEKFDQHCADKKEELKNLKEEKKKASQKKDLNLGLILESTYHLEKEKICKKLIKVTEAALEGNPQLESKIKRLLTEDQSKRKEEKNRQPQSSLPTHSPNILSSNRSNLNSSLICERDSFQDVDIDEPSRQIEPTLDQSQQNVFVVEQPQSLQLVDYGRKENVVEKKEKETVKKSSVKQKEEKPFILPQNLIKQISAQKEKAQTLCEKEQIPTTHENNLAFSNRPQNSLNFFQNMPTSGRNYFTEKKPEANQTVFGDPKIYQSANDPVSSFGRNDGKSQSLAQNVRIQSNQPLISSHTVDAAENATKEEESRYPELEPYIPTNQTKNPQPSNQRFS